MLKVTVLGHAPVMDDVIDALQRADVLEIETHPFEQLVTLDVAPDDERLRTLDEQAADAIFVRDFLRRYHVAEQAFSAFVSEKFHLSRDEYLGLRFDHRFMRLYKQTLTISDGLAANERERARLVTLAHDLEPWEGMHLEISRWRGTDRTVLFTGTVPASQGSEIREALRQEVDTVTVDELGPVGDRQAWVVFAHTSRAEETRTFLARNDFTEVTFGGLHESPAEERARALARIEELDAETEKLTDRATELSREQYHRAVALVQAIQSERDALLVRRDFGASERTFVISGWVRESGAHELEAALAGFDGDVDVTLAPPTDEDRPPVELNNPTWLKPLEVLTDLYGRPRYGELDPTPMIAPFFLAFFGICIGDVGYGAMLIGGAWAVKTYLDVAPGVKRFCSLMMYGGATAMLFGVAFASYFALPVDILPPFLQSLQLLDPLNELTTFLLFTLVLGVIQVFFGVLIAAYDAFRRGDRAEAVFGQLSTIFLFGSIAAMVVSGNGVWLSIGLVGTMLMQGRAIEAALGDAEKPMWDRAIGVAWLLVAILSGVMMGADSVWLWLGVLAGASIVGAIVSKSARAAVLGLLGGAYAVYGMSAFVGDILSYTRLAALGLSGSLVGYVFNLLAGLVWEPAMSLMSGGGIGIAFGVIVALMSVAVFVVGHVFNVVINLLGAFVHPARLQFVEFFSKFYEAGGRVFRPFARRAENLVLEAGGAGSDRRS